jgi:hypothetical protein
MKQLFFLMISALLFASCNKKEAAAPPPADVTQKSAPTAAGHASGGALTIITPPSVIGGQVGPMTVAVQPTGHSHPDLDGNETMVAACTWAAGGQLTVIQSGKTDTSITPLPPGVSKIVALLPATDSVTVNTYYVNVRINGAWFQNTFSTPLNYGTTSLGFETNTYYNGALAPSTNSYAWVMVGDTTYLRGH